MKKKFAFIFSILFFFSGIMFLSAQNNKKTETMVLIKTSKGDIQVKLYNETPLHRDNFIKLVKELFSAGKAEQARLPINLLNKYIPLRPFCQNKKIKTQVFARAGSLHGSDLYAARSDPCKLHAIGVGQYCF